jgi:hypothetical protein
LLCIYTYESKAKGEFKNGKAMRTRCKVSNFVGAPHMLPRSSWPQRQTGIIGGHDPELDGDVAPALGAVDGTPLSQCYSKAFSPP